jgi:tripartite motif-containing protein 37
MMKGYKESNKYEYKIDMIHPDDKEQVVSREYSSDFEIGECWGYNRFYRIEGISDEGYVSTEDGSLFLRFFVRASNYAQHS